MPSPASQLASLFAQYEPATAKLAKALRRHLRQRLPGLFELVYRYESRDSLVISYSPSTTGGEAVCALAVYPHRIDLCLAGGAKLAKSDPLHLLQGAGKQMRQVALQSMADFQRPEIENLIAAALDLAKVQLDTGAQGETVLKIEAQQQRARSRQRRSKT